MSPVASFFVSCYVIRLARKPDLGAFGVAKLVKGRGRDRRNILLKGFLKVDQTLVDFP
jgi:hypothetical protein